VSTGPRAPRWAEALLRLALRDGLSRDGVMGDLEEELGTRWAVSPSAARRWYVRQALGIAARSLVARARPARGGQRSAATTGGGASAPVTRDFGRALKSLRHAPAFVVLAVLTLGVGVGATTTIFSVVNGVLLRPLPDPDADRLVVFSLERDGQSGSNLSEPEFIDLTREDHFQAVAAYRLSSPLLGSTDQPERVSCALASAALFPLLGVQPLLGRFFTAEEDAPGGPAVALLAYGLWTRAFGGDPTIVGRTVLFENIPHTVVGVMPRGFAFPEPSVEVYRPIRLNLAQPWERNNHYISVIARLADGVDARSADARLTELSAASVRTYPEFYAEPVAFRATPLREQIVGDVRTPLLLLMGTVVAVLLIAAVNAASLFLARGEARRGELAVRQALGAARRNVGAQLLWESLIVAVLAGAAGTALAWGGVEALRGLAPPTLPRLGEVALDARVLLFGIGVATLTGLVFGLLPAAQAWRSEVQPVLASGGRGAIGGRRAARARRALVVFQLALATVLGVGAGLLLRTFGALRRVDLGFDPRGVLVVPLEPHASMVANDAPAVAFFSALEARVAALPEVTAVGSALRIPLAEGHDNYSVLLEGQEGASIGEAPAPGMEWATPGYFGALGIPLLRGRLFTAADDEAALPVAVIGDALARQLWPGEEALGKRLRFFGDDRPWIEIVGVVADVKHYGVRAEPSAKLYINHLQGDQAGSYSPAQLNLFVRTEGDPAALAASVRTVARELQLGMPFGPTRTMEQVVDVALGADRFVLVLLAAFALGSLLLAAVGVYGMAAQAVAGRTREIGVRMAVGAGRASILRQVLGEGAVLATIGAALGLGGGLLLSRFLAQLLYQVSPGDPLTYLLVAPLLVGVVLLATLVPALRAARLDPVGALRDG
jgi:putative ABC transport system permease protein